RPADGRAVQAGDGRRLQRNEELRRLHLLSRRDHAGREVGVLRGGGLAPPSFSPQRGGGHEMLDEGPREPRDLLPASSPPQAGERTASLPHSPEIPPAPPAPA